LAWRELEESLAKVHRPPCTLLREWQWLDMPGRMFIRFNIHLHSCLPSLVEILAASVWREIARLWKYARVENFSNPIIFLSARSNDMMMSADPCILTPR
jgi:hypothetical protein